MFAFICIQAGRMITMLDATDKEKALNININVCIDFNTLKLRRIPKDGRDLKVSEHFVRIAYLYSIIRSERD